MLDIRHVQMCVNLQAWLLFDYWFSKVRFTSDCVISHNGGINKPIKNVHKKYINDTHDKNMIM